MAPVIVYHLVFYLCLHACNARTPTVWDKEITHVKQHQLSSKDAKTSSVAEKTTSDDHGTNIIQLGNQIIVAVKEAESIDGNMVNIAYSRKILQQAIGKKEWKRAERQTLESAPTNAEETVNSKDDDSAEDIVFMDYAQPHRKPPIHNKPGT